MGELFFQGLKNLVVRARVSSTGGNAQMEPVSTISHCNCPRKCVFVFWYSKMAKVLTDIHERAGFLGLEELFSATNGYLVHHSPKDIFDVTTAFLVPENVDFGILYAILLTFWIKLLCVIVLMAAILDAILNLTPSAHDPDCPPKFFYLPRGALPGPRVKMRGHLIAHRISLSPGLERTPSGACQKWRRKKTHWKRYFLNSTGYTEIRITDAAKGSVFSLQSVH